MSRIVCSVIVSFLLSLVLPGGQQEAFANCPESIDTSNTACRPWGHGQAKFQWATGENPTSDIVLTAGPCGGPGESGTAYIFAFIDAHGFISACKSARRLRPTAFSAASTIPAIFFMPFVGPFNAASIAGTDTLGWFKLNF